MLHVLRLWPDYLFKRQRLIQEIIVRTAKTQRECLRHFRTHTSTGCETVARHHITHRRPYLGEPIRMLSVQQSTKNRGAVSHPSSVTKRKNIHLYINKMRNAERRNENKIHDFNSTKRWNASFMSRNGVPAITFHDGGRARNIYDHLPIIASILQLFQVLKCLILFLVFYCHVLTRPIFVSSCTHVWRGQAEYKKKNNNCCWKVFNVDVVRGSWCHLRVSTGCARLRCMLLVKNLNPILFSLCGGSRIPRPNGVTYNPAYLTYVRHTVDAAASYTCPWYVENARWTFRRLQPSGTYAPNTKAWTMDTKLVGFPCHVICDIFSTH
jgi:hypothetical protein